MLRLPLMLELAFWHICFRTLRNLCCNQKLQKAGVCERSQPRLLVFSYGTAYGTTLAIFVINRWAFLIS